MKKNLFGISMMTLVGLYVLLSVIIIGLFLIFNLPVQYGILSSIIIIIIQFLISPFLTDLSMKWFYHAKFDAEIPEYLNKFIQEQCTKYNMKYPRIGYINDGSPNAFTYGHTKNDARIVLTRGIFDLLTEDEVLAVVGHELGHVTHYDMLFMTAAALVPLILYYIYEVCSSGNNSDSDSKAGQAKAIVSLVAYLMYIISQYIVLWLSRTREYYADEFSANEIKSPNALAEALVKVGFGLSTQSSSNKKHDVNKNNALGIFDSKTSKSLTISAMDEKGVSKDKIKNAMKWEMWNPWAKWFEFNSTHPLISKRLQALSKLSTKYNQEPYIVFDLKKEESYVDDFLLEIFIAFLPAFFLIATLVCLFININTEDGNFMYTGIGLLLTTIFGYIKFNRAHKKGYKETTVSDLLGEVKVSHITSVPCTLKGTIIGRGNPGCIFNEDFVIKDKTGIIFLDYNQPLNIINKIFALFKSKEYFDKEVEVEGWYRRSPVPYVEIYKYTVDGKVKKIWTYSLSKFMYFILFAISIFLILYRF